MVKAGLLQHPRFNFIVPHAQKIERPTSIVFLGQRRRLVALDLRNNADRDFKPFRKRTERPAQSMQCKVRQAGSFDCTIVGLSGLGDLSVL
ncbi:hypothetical protein WJ25_00715 [Burkholderia thailandensis]|nr:hypothetical protein WJ25_00715 [Burkholderia thailandensis]